jgi:uncharacterized paraquat-inducible protein A
MFVFTKLSKKAWLVLYVLLSGLDLILTHRLLTHNGEMVYEGNPLARFWLHHYGWAGLATFKVLTVELVAVVSLVVSLSSPHLGRRILIFGCLVLLVVNAYSGFLLSQKSPQELQRQLEAPGTLANLYVCPECHSILGVPAPEDGKQVTCPRCHSRFQAVAANHLDQYGAPSPDVVERPFHGSLGTLRQVIIAAIVAGACTLTALLLQPSWSFARCASIQ